MLLFMGLLEFTTLTDFPQ